MSSQKYLLLIGSRQPPKINSFVLLIQRFSDFCQKNPTSKREKISTFAAYQENTSAIVVITNRFFLLSVKRYIKGVNIVFWITNFCSHKEHCYNICKLIEIVHSMETWLLLNTIPSLNYVKPKSSLLY